MLSKPVRCPGLPPICSRPYSGGLRCSSPTAGIRGGRHCRAGGGRGDGEGVEEEEEDEDNDMPVMAEEEEAADLYPMTR